MLTNNWSLQEAKLNEGYSLYDKIGNLVGLNLGEVTTAEPLKEAMKKGWIQLVEG
jgi:hypothetical protein